MVGQTISNYHIVAKLGEGGMGVVYKARDVRLDRFLAVKFVIPERVNPERKRRFFQEARAASALNHPNIIHVYDIGEWEGADFIAMEYVDGSTLQEMLRKGVLSIDEALRYAIQVADALAAAHAAGIVHRDLKPGNVMIGPRGLVKILDFGLAKLKEPDQAEEDEDFSASSDTRTLFEPGLTNKGALIGSPAYMSPEQVLGKVVDARSDIFAFGVLLYEMLTSRQAFSGKARLEIFSAILHVDPPPPSSVNPAVNRELDWVIAHCLRKDPERRFQSMLEVKLALDDLRTGSLSGASSAIAPPPLQATKRRWVAGTVIAIALSCATIAGFWLLRDWKPTPSAGPSGPLEITRLTTEGGLNIDPAISPDGKLLAYASDRSGEGNLDIWVKQIGGSDAIRLTRDPADDEEPSFSPDGTKIVFRSGRDGGGIYMIPALGGAEQKLADAGRRPQFSPDGSKIAYWTGPVNPFPLRSGMGQIFVLDLAGSTTRQILKDFVAAVHPVWSPDGNEILFLGLKDQADLNTYNWWIAPVLGGTAINCRALKRTGFIPFAWRNNRVYFEQADERYGTRIGELAIDPTTRQSVGGPRRLTAATTGEYSPSVSGDGQLVFASVTGNSHLYSVPLDVNRGKATGALERLTTAVADDIVGSISREGKRVVFQSTRTGFHEIWGKDLTTGRERALTTGGRPKTSPQISRDGLRVAWKGSYVNDVAIFVTPFEGGAPVQICADCGLPAAWLPDGKSLVYSRRKSSRFVVGLLNVVTGNTTEYMQDSQLGLRVSSISDDQKWVAFQTYRTERDFEIYVAQFSPDRAPPRSEWVRIPHSPGAHANPRWSPNGNLLYFISERDGYTCLWAQRLDPATKHPVSEPFAVQHFHSPSLQMYSPSLSDPIALASDKIVVSLEERSGGIWMLKLQN